MRERKFKEYIKFCSDQVYLLFENISNILILVFLVSIYFQVAIEDILIFGIILYFLKTTLIYFQISKSSFINEARLKVTAYHETGHYIIAKELGVSVLEVNILEDIEYSRSGATLLALDASLSPDKIENLVKVYYGGYAAEKLFTVVTNGSIGFEMSDMEKSNQLLEDYILLTEEDLSFTGYERDFIEAKSIELSKKWMAETKAILEKNKVAVEEFQTKLVREKRIQF